MKKLLFLFTIGITALVHNSFGQNCTANFSAVNSSTINDLHITITNLNPNPTLQPGTYADYWESYAGYRSYFYGQNSKIVYPSSPGIYTFHTGIEIRDSATNNLICIDSTPHTVTVAYGTQSNPCYGKTPSFYTYNQGLSISFFPTSTSVPGYMQSHHWDFGDGATVSTSNYTTHTYANTGTYNAKLITTWTNGPDICVDSTTQTVTVAITNTQISGNVYFNNSLPSANSQIKVWLIQKDTINSNTYLTAIDSQLINVSTPISYTYPFSFVNVPVSTSFGYYLKAAVINGPTSGTGPIPTYYYSSPIWDTASTVWHNGGNIGNYDIHMLTGTVTSGPGFVGGNVAQGANKGTGSGIAGMTVLLFDNNGSLLKSVMTDANGDYSFGSLPIGFYKVYPEDAGYATTPAIINITNGNISISGINFTRSNSKQSITPEPTSVSEIYEESKPSVYPNPASDVVTVRWSERVNEEANVIISDITGKTIIEMVTETNGSSNIDISELNSGIYIISIRSEHLNFSQKLTKQ